MAQDKCRAAPRVLRRRILRNGLNSWDGLERPRRRLMLAWGIAPGLIRNQKPLALKARFSSGAGLIRSMGAMLDTRLKRAFSALFM